MTKQHSASIDAMRVFSFLTGRWRGQKTENNVAVGICEDVGQYEISGAVFTVGGKSFDLTGEVLQVENFGVFSYDKFQSRYTIAAHANGKVGRGIVNVHDDGSIEVYPQGGASNIRLTMFPGTSSSWRETGEQRDEQSDTWKPLFEIDFQRVE